MEIITVILLGYLGLQGTSVLLLWHCTLTKYMHLHIYIMKRGVQVCMQIGIL